MGGQESTTFTGTVDADGQVRAIGDTFDVDGEQLAYPGDPSGSAGNVINCRCTIAILTPDEYADARADGRTAARMIDVRSAKRMLELVKEHAA